LPSSAFRDERELAGLMNKLHLPDADAWFKKSTDDAVQLDKDADGETGAGFVVSSTFLVVGDMIKIGKLDDALEITRKLDATKFSMNRTMCMSAIVGRLLQSDLPRALKLMEEMPDSRGKNSLTAKAAAVVAKKDLPAAMLMIESLPAGSQADAASRIAQAAQTVDFKSLTQLFQNIAAARVKSMGTRRSSIGSYASDDIFDRLPLAITLTLAPQFDATPDIYAQHLLASVVIACGLSEDPIWRRYMLTPTDQDARIPWGSDSLHSALAGRRSAY